MTHMTVRGSVVGGENTRFVPSDVSACNTLGWQKLDDVVDAFLRWDDVGKKWPSARVLGTARLVVFERHFR